MALTHLHFDTGSALADWCDTATTQHNLVAQRYIGTNDEIAECSEAGKRNLREGNLTHLEAINKLLDTFTDTIATPRRVNRANVRGHRVNMSAYLAGAPNSMFRREFEPSVHEPIRVYFNCTFSNDIAHRADLINTRGAALAAFALSLANERPVYLTPYSYSTNGAGQDNYMHYACKGAVISVDINTSPLVLSELAGYFDIATARHLFIWAKHAASPHADGRKTALNTFNAASMAQLLNIGPDDIHIGPLSSNDPMVRDPINWLKTNLAKYTSGDSNAA